MDQGVLGNTQNKSQKGEPSDNLWVSRSDRQEVKKIDEKTYGVPYRFGK